MVILMVLNTLRTHVCVSDEKCSSLTDIVRIVRIFIVQEHLPLKSNIQRFGTNLIKIVSQVRNSK